MGPLMVLFSSKHVQSGDIVYLFTYLFSVKNGKIVAGKPQPLVTNSPKFPIKIKNSDAQKGAGLLFIG